MILLLILFAATFVENIILLIMGDHELQHIKNLEDFHKQNEIAKYSNYIQHTLKK